MLKAARIVAFILAWGQLRDELDREPTVADYIEVWGEKRSTAFKHLQEFREVFDRCDTPSPVLDAMPERQPSQRGSWTPLVAA